MVTETFDCSGAPDWLRRAAGDGAQWATAMTVTLNLLHTEGGDPTMLGAEQP